MKSNLTLIAILAPLLLLGSACVTAKVYQLDRQTVLEDEAAGEWPEFDQEIINKTQASGPTPFATVAESSRKERRLFNVLNGELVSTPAPAQAAGKPQASPAQGKSR
jgi:hypothetical protein